jgi:hypothetical protein
MKTMVVGFIITENPAKASMWPYTLTKPAIGTTFSIWTMAAL